MAKIDLKDAYFGVSVTEEHRKYLCFDWKGDRLAFQILPFGLALVPPIFTKTLELCLATLRNRGDLAGRYVDTQSVEGEYTEGPGFHFVPTDADGFCNQLKEAGVAAITDDGIPRLFGEHESNDRLVTVEQNETYACSVKTY